MAIDYGKKRCGIAVTDEFCIVASPLATRPPEQLISFVQEYALKNKLSTIVIGLPKKLNMDDTHVTQEAISLKTKLDQEFGELEVVLYDERFTSKMAYESLVMTGASKKLRKNKGLLDETSAVLLLQSYMQSKTM